MSGRLPEELNAFGELLTELSEKRGFDRSDLARRMVRAGWNVDYPQDTIRYACRKRTPSLNFDLLCYVALALDLTEAEEDELLLKAYRSRKAQKNIRAGNGSHAGSSLMASIVSS